MTADRSDAPAEPMRVATLVNSVSDASAANVSASPRRARRLRLMLTAVAAASVMVLSSNAALASSGRTPHRGYPHGAAVASKIAAKQARLARQAHARTARAGSARARTHAPAPVHTDVVPLVNTSWDHPALSPAVLEAIRTAARETGIDPNLLMTIAWRESRFDPQARNHHSSANGLLQFTSGTWLQTVHDFGAQHGAAAYAAAIHKERSGELTVPNRHTQTAILRLRSDPVLSATLAAENMARQRAAMPTRLGRGATPADLYLLHVLGPSGAARFLTAFAQHPSLPSFDVASRRTLRNAGLLARDGRPMTVASTYAAVEAMLDAQRAHSAPLLARADGKADASRPTVIEVSQAP